MPPKPLHPSVRQRRNVAPSASVLDVLDPGQRAQIAVPELSSDRLWDPRTSDFWTSVWQSPMRLEWDAGDHHKLLMMAFHLDEFYRVAGEPEMKSLDRAYAMNKHSKSLMDLGSKMGLDPFARRSLQWVLVQTEKAEAERDHTKAKTATERARPKRKGLSALE